MVAGFKKSQGKPKGRKAIMRGKMPQKRTINLAPIGVKKINAKLILAELVLVALIGALFGKFFVVDRYASMLRASAEVSTLRTQLAEEYDKVASYGYLEDEYAHYNYSGMTEEELSLVDRAAIIRLVQEETRTSKGLDSWSLSGNLLTLTVSGRDLQEINQMAKQLENFDLVEACTVVAATKEDVQDPVPVTETVRPENYVRANILVYLQSEEKEQKEEEEQA